MLNLLPYFIFFHLQLLNSESIKAPVDLGIQGIQAVAKITLKDKKTVYGFIEICRGGYDYRYKAHGFSQQYKNGDWHIILFDLNFGGFHIAEHGTFKPGKKTFWMVNVSPESYEKSDTLNRKVTFDAKMKTLGIQYPFKNKFELKNEIVLYQDIPPDEWIGYGDTAGIQKIYVKMDEIYSFNLEREPDVSWLKKIERAKKKRNNRKEEEAQDAIYPGWYHQIVKNENTMLLFQKYFTGAN